MAQPCATWTPLNCCDLTGISPAITGAAADAATEILWALSGRQFGVCPTMFRPCRRDCLDLVWDDWAGAWPNPALIQGRWLNLGCGSCAGDCQCTPLFEFTLPPPVSGISSIVIDGAVLPTGSYQLVDGNRVVRTDGGQWPLCNNLAKPDGAVGTWTVTAQLGTPVPQAGLLAAGELTCELAKAACGDTSCQLPSWWMSQITREGLTINFGDFGIALSEGRVGLPISDMFVNSVNPGRIPARAAVFSPDKARHWIGS